MGFGKDHVPPGHCKENRPETERMDWISRNRDGEDVHTGQLLRPDG